MELELLGRKLGMTQIFTEAGDRVPVTVVQTGPCVVVQKKTPEQDGYSAVQLGFEEAREKHLTRPLLGHFTKAGVTGRRHLFEVRLDPEQVAALEIGQELRCGETFEPGKKVDVTGTSKGRGFTGVVKRWGFKTHSSTHGTHEYFRHGGAMSAGTYPGRVPRGKKMAGQYGAERVTTLGLELVRVDGERDLLFIRGGVPGHRHGLVRVRPSLRH
ncbi:MAG: 50S ribosomal protein L3 [Myxococcota bacterium]